MSRNKILIIDDREDVRSSTRWLLEDNDYQVLEAETPAKAKDILTQECINVILLDMNYSQDTTSGAEGFEFLEWLNNNDVSVPTVAMTAWKSDEIIIRAMQLGAYDFVVKPWENERILQIIQNGIILHGLKVQNQKLQQRLEASRNVQQYQWRSGCMVALLEEMQDVAETDATILLTGENGTGKTELARFIHDHSLRRNGPFISVNMGAIPESLFETEMFGHRKGAFTDAKTNRIGRFQLAEGGTLFLDEIANIPLSQQAKILRVIESGEYEHLGSSITSKANTRLISASNANFEKLIATEQFREDLFYRLNIIDFHIPALRERKDDIVPLAEFFIDLYSKEYRRDPVTLSECAKSKLRCYDWPGNIRELGSAMSRAVLFGKGKVVAGTDLRLETKTLQANNFPLVSLEEMEGIMVKRAIEISNGNTDVAAELLGKSRASIYRLLKKHNVD